MRIIKFAALFLAITLLSFNEIHKFYVSVTQIEYIKEKKEIQIITRIFIDDFEKLLKTRYDNSIILSEDKDQQTINLYLERYLNEKLQITLNNQKVNFIIIGKEYDNDLLFVYLEIDNVKSLKSIEVSNKILFEMFEDQQNIVKIKANSQNKNYILTPQNYKALLKL